MKKFTNLALALTFASSILIGTQVEARLFEDKCNPTPKCEPDPIYCYDCAPNRSFIKKELAKCAKKDKPYNYYSWSLAAEKEIASDIYDWADSPSEEIPGY